MLDPILQTADSLLPQCCTSISRKSMSLCISNVNKQLSKTADFVPDLATIYNSAFLDPTWGPRELQNKVQWDIRFYFARRGKENFYEMRKDTFEVITDQKTGLKYVKKAIDEEDKNHKGDQNEIVTGVMPQMKSKHFCPVNSFEVYLSLLSEEVDYLW